MCVDAWASAGSGGSFRAVAPAAESGIGLVLRGERVTYENVRKNAYAQDGQELGASAGACRAGSLAGARSTLLSKHQLDHQLLCTLQGTSSATFV